MIDRENEGRPFAIWGISYGAYLGYEILRKYPDRVLAFCSVVPLIIADEDQRELPEFQLIEEDGSLQKLLSPERAEGMQPFLVLQNESVVKQMAEYDKNHPGNDEEFLERIRSDNNTYALKSDGKALSAPFDGSVLYITGRFDNITGHEAAWQQSKQMSRCSFVVLDAAGHLLIVEQGNLFQELVRDWLLKAEAFSRLE